MAGNFTLEGKNGELAFTMLKSITDLFDENDIDYWLEGGTLLGVVRENRLLPWDNDLDISIKEDQWPKLEKILKKIKYRVRERRFTTDNAPFKKGVTRLVKVSNRRFYFFKGEVVLDIFIKFKQDEDYFWQVGNTQKSVPANFYAKTILYPFLGKDFKVPENYTGYLTNRYGDWKTPVKVWNTFTDDQAINGDI